MLKKLTANIIHLNPSKKLNLILKLSFFISSSMLISALYLQYFEKVLPCNLCITQRWFHVAIILYSLIMILILRVQLIHMKLVVLGIALVWLFSGFAGMYHFGIELKLWAGPDTCTSNISFSKDLLQHLLNKSPIKCDEVMFKVFDISLAGWNAIVSIMISLFTCVLLVKKGF